MELRDADRAERQDEKSPCESVSRVRGVNTRETRKLVSIGIYALEQLAGTDPDALTAALGWNPRKALDIVLHARALFFNQCYQKAPIQLPMGVIYFYDIETFGTLTCLHGVIRRDCESREERSFMAHDPADEGVAWREFLEYISQDREAVIYSWTNYERKFVHKLWDDYGGNREGWKLISDNLQDHCALTKNHFALPTKSYGLKSVAPIFGFDWHTPDPSGRKAEEWYRNWLETGDDRLLKEIITYNLDDVRAMEVIHSELEKIVSNSGYPS